MTRANSPKAARIAEATDDAALAEAARLLTGGQIVAVPTETVYGLAANAADAGAVARIYAAKGRPDFNPLIVHVASLDRVRRLVEMSAEAERLAESFWPGPLTMVLPKRQDAPVAEAVSAGLPTLAVRCPAHSAMRALLERSDLALAAPSANRSGAISPTTARHVAEGLGASVPLILDGGACARGLESTIVALGAEGWRCLRPGPIAREAIAALIGAESREGARGIEAPGQLAGHYAPTKPVRLNALAAEKDEWLIGFGTVAGDENLSPGGDTAEAAARLYAALHRADEAKPPRIAVAPIHGPMAEAINDRLVRAAHR